MSKRELKKYLQSLTNEQVIEQVIELYGNCKPAKEYLEYFLNPDEKGQFEKYKAVIINEFSMGKRIPKMRFSVAKKALADFRQVNPSPELYGDLMLTLAEVAWKLANDSGDLWEQYYISSANNYEAALKFLQKNDLLDKFKLRCTDCVKYSKYCGYGCEDLMDQLFNEYFG